MINSYSAIEKNKDKMYSHADVCEAQSGWCFGVSDCVNCQCTIRLESWMLVDIFKL